MAYWSLLKLVHLVGLFAWVGGLLALSRLLWSHGATPTAPASTARLTQVERALYRTLVGPGLFLVVFTGAWMLHQRQALLREPFMHVKLSAVGALLVVDHLCLRGISRLERGVGTIGGRRYAVAHLVTVALALSAVALIVIRPFARAA